MSASSHGWFEKSAVWDKGMAASERFIFDIATKPAILGYLRLILGEDIILWGGQFRSIDPGKNHVWHSDIESAAPQARFVSVWIGLDNTAHSKFKLVTRSHRFGMSVQETQQEQGFRRGQAGDVELTEWARTRDGDAEIVQPQVTNGDAIFFDGRLWHCAQINQGDASRTALLLQYAQGGQSVFMADYEYLEWPWRLITDRRPPVIAVSGTADQDANTLVPPPSLAGSRKPIAHFARSLDLPLGRNTESGWQPHPLFRGPVPAAQEMGCHVSVLEAGHCPHPPHVHIEEEVLIVLDGKAEIVSAIFPEDPSPRLEILTSGDFIYHPTHQHHTIRNIGHLPLTYLMFKWRSAALDTDDWLGPTVMRLAEYPPGQSPRPFDPRVLFEGGTAYLEKLHAHVTNLQPAAGYEPHADAYDVAIILLAGTIETIGETLTAPAVTYHADGELHGIFNPGSEPARYLVLEFHAATAPSVDSEVSDPAGDEGSIIAQRDLVALPEVRPITPSRKRNIAVREYRSAQEGEGGDRRSGGAAPRFGREHD